MNKTIIINSIFAFFFVMTKVIYDISWSYLFWSVFVLGVLWVFIKKLASKKDQELSKNNYPFIFLSLCFVLVLLFITSFFLSISAFEWLYMIIPTLIILPYIFWSFKKRFLKNSIMAELFFDALIFAFIFIYSYGISILFDQIHFASILFFKETARIFMSLLPGVFLVGSIYFFGTFVGLALKDLLSRISNVKNIR